ncbi:hypothetical protein ACV4JM_004808 [Salmonella enterica subsp. enterica serovar Altona]|nr:hypothetical protein [Salmonella enterica subsp. enterica serovar Agona]
MLYLLAICYVCQVITKRYAGSFVTRDLGGNEAWLRVQTPRRQTNQRVDIGGH